MFEGLIDYEHGMQDASKFGGFIEGMFNLYKDMYGIDQDEKGWEVVSSRELDKHKGEVNVLGISEGNKSPGFYELEFSVPKGFSKDHQDFLRILDSSTSRRSESILYGIVREAEEQDRHLALQFAVKPMNPIIADAQHEREGFDELTIIGVSTLTCLHPSPFTIMEPKLNTNVVTLVEEGLQPLDAIEKRSLLDTRSGDSLVSKAIGTLATMHQNKFIHGDFRLRNLGIKDDMQDENIYVMDPELWINFKKELPKLTGLKEVEKARLIENFYWEFGLEEEDIIEIYDTPEYFVKALELDLKKFADSLGRVEDLNELDYSVNQYLAQIVPFYNLNEEFSENVRSYFGLQSRD